ncbi:hypothetical protein TNCV_158801 [Trichonephila clavipes]|uniref:Uncharacterized protein n=1 Tax=Trichonephila clavipes TaxID=2585209 RepID=A0A8X6REG3_TRICX|nr:hypothetical protein TNCV_158801 [Trichonephila clavipes]
MIPELVTSTPNLHISPMCSSHEHFFYPQLWECRSSPERTSVTSLPEWDNFDGQGHLLRITRKKKDFPEVINSIVVVKIPNPTYISLVWVPTFRCVSWCSSFKISWCSSVVSSPSCPIMSSSMSSSFTSNSRCLAAVKISSIISGVSP